jgi:hypothetical protein
MATRPHATLKKLQTRQAYTQTYSTADRTHANSTYVAPSGGATQDAEGRASLAQLAVDVVDLKQLVNALIDDLQTLTLIR